MKPKCSVRLDPRAQLMIELFGTNLWFMNFHFCLWWHLNAIQKYQ